MELFYLTLTFSVGVFIGWFLIPVFDPIIFKNKTKDGETFK